MTLRKKGDPSADVEILPGMGTKAFRTAVFFLLLSMHPVGRQILATAGFKFPDEQKVAAVAEKAETYAKDISELKDAVKELKEGQTATRAATAIAVSKMDEVSKTLQGFSIDLNEFRKHVDIKASGKITP